MLATLAVAWRTVTKRIAADWLIVGAVTTTIVLAAALLAAGPIYADAVTISALQRTIRDAPVTATAVSAGITLFPRDFDAVDEVARSTLTSTFASTGSEVVAHVETDAFGLEPSSADITDLATFQHFEDIEQRATLLGGRWPGPTGGEVEVALPSAAADALGVEIGDNLSVVNRRQPELSATVLIVGVFEADDPTDPYWFDDPLISQGLVESGEFRTFGPFVASLETILGSLTANRATATWRTLPEFEHLTVAGLSGLRNELGDVDLALQLQLIGTLGDRASSTSGFETATDLPALLADVERSLTVTRSSVLALLIQLAILAGYALVLTAGLLSDTRRTETALLRSRGSSPRQILAMALLEGVVVAVPAAIAAPFMATWLLGILNSVGPLAAIDLTLEPVTTPESFALAGLAALVAIAVLAWPAYRSARAFPSSSTGSRQKARPASQRIGLDLALLALTILAFWQLGEIGPEISARVRGRFGVDPLLIVTPALGLLAGGVLALRVVPLLARAAEWVASSGRGSVAALSSWQVARRPARYARSALLLIVAVGIGIFAASFSATWARSQIDQASFQIGADLRVAPGQGSSEIAPLFLAEAHETIDGVETSMPVRRTLSQIGRGGSLGQFVALQSSLATSTVDIRSDLAPGFEDLIGELRPGTPGLASVELAGEPHSLVLVFETIETIPEGDEFQPCEFLEENEEPDFLETCFAATADVVIRDGAGFLYRLAGGALEANVGPMRLEVPLVGRTADGSLLAPRYPLELVGIEVRMQLPEGSSREVAVSLLEASTTQDGEIGLPIDLTRESFEVSLETVGAVDRRPSVGLSPQRPNGLLLEVVTGSGFGGPTARIGLRPTGPAPAEALPVLVTPGLLEALGSGIGDAVPLPQLRIPVDAMVVGTIDAFPSTDPALGEVVVFDLPLYQQIAYAPGAQILQPDEYWISTGGDEGQATQALLASPYRSATVDGKRATLETLVADPVALATIGALTVGFVAAAVFATVGFAVSATVSARERIVEFALIRALGLSRRQLGSWLILEQGALILLSLALGTLVGVVLTVILLPLVTLTQGGSLPQPPVEVLLPWDVIAIIEIAVVGMLAIVVAAMTVLLRRVGLGALLRMGEN